MADEKLTLESGIEISRSEVDEIKKAPGENGSYFIFKKATQAGRERLVATEKDVQALGGAIKQNTQDQ